MKRGLIILFLTITFEIVLSQDNNVLQDRYILGFRDSVHIYNEPDSIIIKTISWGDSLLWIKKQKGDYYGIYKNIRNIPWFKVKYHDIIGWVKKENIADEWIYHKGDSFQTLIKFGSGDGRSFPEYLLILNYEFEKIKYIGSVTDFVNGFWINETYYCYYNCYYRNINIFNSISNQINKIATGESPRWDNKKNKLIYLYDPGIWHNNQRVQPLQVRSVDINGDNDTLIYDLKEKNIEFGHECAECYADPDLILSYKDTIGIYSFDIHFDNKYLRYYISSDGKFIEIK